MRLLQLHGDSDFSLVEYADNNTPPYAILSHTWGADNEEVTFKDLGDSKHKTKAGYRKLIFCGKQAAEDGLQFFWIDTCCIDKSSSAELSEAINSMFRWYLDATKCYVYLSDVSISGTERYEPSSNPSWETHFQRSRWFTRGWTLQELLAPGIVEFFSNEGTRLGDKITFEQEIHQVTKIPFAALRRQARLSEFSIDERMSWAAQRTTSKKEDKAYCLLGILEVFLPLIYGEGEYYALQRLREEAERRQANQLMMTSPREIIDPSSLLCSRNDILPTARLMEIADNSIDAVNGNTTDTSSFVSTQETGENICGDYFTSIENRPAFDRYTGIYDCIGSNPKSLMCITRAREYFGASGPKKHKEIQSDSSDFEYASRSTNCVPYELDGMHLYNDTLVPQIATRTNNASSIKGPFPSPHRPWSPAEDQTLLNLMKSGSKRDWNVIAKKLPKRTRRACEFRYEKLK